MVLAGGLDMDRISALAGLASMLDLAVEVLCEDPGADPHTVRVRMGAGYPSWGY